MENLRDDRLPIALYVVVAFMSTVYGIIRMVPAPEHHPEPLVYEAQDGIRVW